MSLIIRPETSADAAAIHALVKAAFLDVPYAAHTEHFIVDALREAGVLTISLVAEDEASVVGHVAVSPVTIAPVNLSPDTVSAVTMSSVTVSSGIPGWYGLGPIAVSPGRQRQGIGSTLMRSALQQLKDSGSAGCVLAGHPAYYGRFGFQRQDELILPEVPAEFFLVSSFSPSVPTGIVRFHEAFATRG